MPLMLVLGLVGCAPEMSGAALDSAGAIEPFDCRSDGEGDARLCAHGASCLDVLERGESLGDGFYRLDPDGIGEGASPWTAFCDMSTEGGGWTVLTGALLRELELVRFEHVAGRGTPELGWTADDGLWLSPEGADGCDTMALRATATLPLVFETWWGSWTAGGAEARSQHDDVYDRLDWGEVTEDCRGHIKFGTDLDDQKTGGEWGLHWTGQRVFSWGIEQVTPTDTIRWELVDQGAPEDLLVTDLEIYLR